MIENDNKEQEVSALPNRSNNKKRHRSKKRNRSRMFDGTVYDEVPGFGGSILEVPMPSSDATVVLTMPGGQEFLIHLSTKDLVLNIYLPERMVTNNYQVDGKPAKVFSSDDPHCLNTDLIFIRFPEEYLLPAKK